MKRTSTALKHTSMVPLFPPSFPFLISLLYLWSVLFVLLGIMGYATYPEFWLTPVGGIALLTLFHLLGVLIAIYAGLDLYNHFSHRGRSKVAMISVPVALGLVLIGFQFGFVMVAEAMETMARIYAVGG